MERARVNVIILVCVFGRVCGTKVDVRVKPGDNITLYCDRIIPHGSYVIWFKKCSHEDQPSLPIDPANNFLETLPRFSVVPNSSSNSYDLHIVNVSVSDEGIYYCALKERNCNQNGNRTTHLSVLELASHSDRLNVTSSRPAVSDCVFCWTLLIGVCLLCVLLFSICVHCFCQRKTTVSTATQTENKHYEREVEVCYASLNKPPMQKKLKLQSSDFSIYTEVQTNRK